MSKGTLKTSIRNSPHSRQIQFILEWFDLQFFLQTIPSIFNWRFTSIHSDAFFRVKPMYIQVWTVPKGDWIKIHCVYRSMIRFRFITQNPRSSFAFAYNSCTLTKNYYNIVSRAAQSNSVYESVLKIPIVLADGVSNFFFARAALVSAGKNIEDITR